MKKTILFITITLLSIYPSKINAQYIFSTSYTMDDGLAANRIYNILQDSLGFMWFCTDDGLSRFDGIRFKNYYLSDYVKTAVSNRVRSILIDRKNKMWIGLDNGIVIYDSHRDTFRAFDITTDTGESIDASVVDMIEDSDGEIWIATNGKGLYRFSPHAPAQLSVYRNITKDIRSTTQNSITTLFQDVRQNIWVGTESEGVYCFDKEEDKFISYKNTNDPNSLSDNSILKLFEDSHGNLWIGTFQNGLDLFNPSTQTFTNFQDKSPDNLLYHIHDIKEYRPGELLIASDNGIGFFKVENGTIVKTNNPPFRISTETDKFIHAIYIDKEESLWMGTYFDGVKFYSTFQNYFHYYSCTSSSHDQSGKVINVIREDKDNSFWIGTDDNGIFRFNDKTQEITPFRNATSIGTTYYCIHDLLLDGSKLFAATYERGLEIFDLRTGEMKSYLHNPEDSTSIPSSNVFCLYKASNGHIYIGTSNGICYYNPITDCFSRVETINCRISCIVEDYSGTIWIGTRINGLFSYNIKTEKINSYRHSDSQNSLTSDAISTLCIDQRKRLWIGTYGWGLCRYNSESDNFTGYKQLNLPNKIVSSIIPTGDLLWISTNKGLAQFNIETGHLKTYSKSNGLYNEQFTPGAGYESPDGRIFLGSTDGFCYFSPQNLQENRYNPPVILTNITISGKDVNEKTPDSPLQHSIVYTSKISLKHSQSVVGFDFAALSYIAPKENGYQYMLEGLDSDWQFTKGSNNHLSYANLPAGEYVLRIKGTNSDKIWSPHEVALKIKVLPPFFRSRLAYMIYIIALLIIMLLTVWYYIKRTENIQKERIRKINDEKEKELYDSKINFFTNIAHEIRTPLSLIIGPLEYLMEKTDFNDIHREYLGIIEQNYKRLHALVTQLLDFRKVDADAYMLSYDSYKVKETITKVIGIFELSAIQKKISIDVSSIPEEMMIVTDEEAFIKIISNLLSNALKYAKSMIQITALEMDKEIVTTITDDGIGVTNEEKDKIFKAFYQVKTNSDINKLGIGIGLHMTRSLVQLMNGKIEVTDRPDGESGVSISVYLPKQMVIRPEQPVRKVGDMIIQENNMEEMEEFELTTGPTQDSPGKQYGVMVVDDNPEILDFLSRILSEEYFVISASSGEEALRILEKNNIDLVICDVMMEKMDGFEVCSKIKSNINISHTPVILLTAKTDTESKIKGLDAGADAYIEKPFSPIHLKAQLCNLLLKRERLQKDFAALPFTDLRTTTHNKLDEEFMERCTEIILHNIDDSSFSVNILAQELNMSRTSLFTKIKGIIGMTPNDFIKTTRLKKACKMMMEGEYRITEIGFLVGFSSSSYFAKCFQKQFGMLPTEFLKQSKDTDTPPPTPTEISPGSHP